MSDGLGALAVMVIPVSCLLYLIWAGARRGGRDRTQRATLEYARAGVKFHGVWGMVLSLPLVFGGVATSIGSSAHWHGQLVLAAALGCWAVAAAAIKGLRVPAPLRWLPLVVTCTVLALLPSGSGTVHGYLFFFAVYSLAGVGLAAWVIVSVSFARSVMRRDRIEKPSDRREVTRKVETGAAGWRSS